MNFTNQSKKLGEILVEKGIVTSLTVDRVLAFSERHAIRFGAALEAMGLVTDEELADALARQFYLPMMTDIRTYYYPPELLRLVTVEVATRHLIFPLNVDNATLELATADPTDMKIARNVASNNGLTLVPFVAARRDIHAAICKYYLGIEEDESPARTILIVEDDMLIQKMMGDILSAKGYRVLSARDGIEGFKLAIARKPHIIISDQVMPKLDGTAFFKSLKALPETSSIPVIMVSSMMTAEEEAAAFDMGIFDFIQKPINENVLVARVKRAFWFHDHRYRFI
jgi:CheY-like chemotaxis protein